jgi:hypothetical protein
MNPQSIALTGAPLCKVVVTDGVDAEIHIFSVRGKFLESIPLGSLVDSVPGTFRVAASRDGTIAISEDTRGTMAVARKGRMPWKQFAPPSPIRESRFGNALAFTRDGSIVDHWFAPGRTWRSDGWQSPVPLMRLFNAEGAQLGQVGKTELFEGASFTPALNRGMPAVEGDTIFFARRSDARVLRFLVDSGAANVRPLAPISLPIGFEMRPPRERIGAKEYPITRYVEEHLTSFAIEPGGGFFVGMILSYAPGETVGALPRGALGVFDRSARLVGLYESGGLVRSLAVSEDLIYAIIDDGMQKTAELKVFTNPTAGSRVSSCGSGK